MSYTSSDGGIVVMGHGRIERMHVTWPANQVRRKTENDQTFLSDMEVFQASGIGTMISVGYRVLGWHWPTDCNMEARLQSRADHFLNSQICFVVKNQFRISPPSEVLVVSRIALTLRLSLRQVPSAYTGMHGRVHTILRAVGTLLQQSSLFLPQPCHLLSPSYWPCWIMIDTSLTFCYYGIPWY